MKTKMKTLIIVLLAAPVIAFAQYQSPIQKVYEKYAGQEGFTSVNISKELFQMLMKMEVNGEKANEIKEFQSMMEQLDGLKIISFEDTANTGKAAGLYTEFSALFPSSSFTELMSVKENGNNIRFMTKQDPDGKILELVMLAEEKGEVTLLSLVGRIDMSTVSKISRSMKIEGMENLQKIREKEAVPK